MAHVSNSTVCPSHSMGSWILDSGASDHTKVPEIQLEQTVNNMVYYLQSPTPIVCDVSASPDIIHHRLGHSSLDKLKVFVPQLSHLKSLDCESR
ncbi:hypothetical protein MTR_6g037440 [Medicago truncatula]|uniref:GAG-pre-integrase domain-containing protein n=1 Tax=Medicago truncatula TaxID=3880 RepID=A0A072U959_MEDTR|nr:hypothetical protein MTR_6g037440 [Medicago truncatula]